MTKKMIRACRTIIVEGQILAKQWSGNPQILRDPWLPF
jgi:hypothetical protein